MQVDAFEIPVKARFSSQNPFVTRLRMRSESSMWCSLLFGSPSLFEVKELESSQPRFQPFEIPESESPGFYGIWNGFWGASGGDTAFVALEEGFLPRFLRRMLGQDPVVLTREQLTAWFQNQDGGLGAYLRHSVFQVIGEELRLRHAQNPGFMNDVEWIGDFVFGLGPSDLWREPYLNPEKRETLRKDLGLNKDLVKDEAGLFWFASHQGRLLRMAQTEVKARPTPLKMPADGGLGVCVAGPFDHWMYALTREARHLVRFRRNPESLEEEMQMVSSFETPVTGLCVSATNDLVLSVADSKGAKLQVARLEAAADPEIPGPLPILEDRGVISDQAIVNCLTLGPRGSIWGVLQVSGSPQLLRMSL